LKNTKPYLLVALGILLVLLFVLDILFGSISMSISEALNALMGKGTEASVQIVQQIRLPKAITAVLAGMALSVCGILMQTLFRNPLAGPYVLGVNSGANLGVALVMLSSGFFGFEMSNFFADLGVVSAAVIGSLAVLFLVMAVAKKVKNNTGLLLAGIMLGQMIASFQSLLEYFSSAESLKGFIMWNMASIGSTTLSDLSLFAPLTIIICFLTLFLIKKLDVILLGENYASSLGINVKQTRFIIILITGVLSGIVTAFCGPIAFIGIAVPHLSRLFFKTSLHRYVVPASMLLGPSIMLLCDIICQLPVNGVLLPLNVITSLIGAPVILYLLLKNKNVEG
jgi:iron complex transport system permease protein